MTKYLVYVAVAAAVALQACSSQVYNNKEYVKANNLNGKKIAILPVEVEFTGRLPKGANSVYATEEQESASIQNLIYSQYLYKSSQNKNRVPVELINVDQVNSRLRDNGIDTRKSWSMNPDSLGKLVGADMVLKIRVRKNRIMSDAAAFGIDMAGNIIDNLLTKNSNNASGVTPAGSTKTYNINLEATLSDVNSNVVITKFSRQGDASWSNSPENVVKSTGRKIVRKGVVYAQQ